MDRQIMYGEEDVKTDRQTDGHTNGQTDLCTVS